MYFTLSVSIRFYISCEIAEFKMIVTFAYFLERFTVIVSGKINSN